MATVKYFIESEDRSKGGVESARRGLKDLEAQGARAGSTVQSGFAGIPAKAAAAGAAIALLAKGLWDLGQAAIQSFAENERVTLRLEESIRRTGGNLNQMNSFLTELSKVTLTAGTELNALAAQYTQLGYSQEVVERLLTAAVSFANTTGESLESVAKNLAKTLAGTSGEIGELLPELRAMTAEQLRSGEALDYVNTRLASYNQLLAGSTSQGIKNFHDALDNLANSTGNLLSRVFGPVVNWLVGVFEKATEIINNIIAEINKAEIEAVIREIDQLHRKQSAFSAVMRAIHLGTDGSPDANFQREARRQVEAGNIEYSDFPLTVDAFKAWYTAYYTKFGERIVELEARKASLMPQTPASTIDTTFVPPATPQASALPVAATPQLATTIGTTEPIEIELPMPDWWTLVRPWWTDHGGVDPLAQPARAPARAPETVLEKLGAMLGGIGSATNPAGESLDLFAAGLDAVIAPLASVQALLDPMGVILAGVMDVLAPLIDQALAPLLGVLRVLGQFIGQVLAPIFKVLGFVLEPIVAIFVWLHNKVFMPFGNAIIRLVGTIWNAIVDAYNWLIGWLVGRMKRMDIEGSLIQEIKLGDVTSAGTATGGDGTGVGGTAAHYTGGKSLTTYVYIYTDVITGDGGFEQLARRLKGEIDRQAALGY